MVLFKDIKVKISPNWEGLSVCWCSMLSKSLKGQLQRREHSYLKVKLLEIKMKENLKIVRKGFLYFSNVMLLSSIFQYFPTHYAYENNISNDGGNLGGRGK